MTKVAILGAGPAGLIAAHVVERNGHEPVIFARAAEKSTVNPDMFLQQPIPGVHESERGDFYLEYIAMGEAAVYAEKVYGSEDAPVSWDRVTWGRHPAWWLSDAYDALWVRYGMDVQPAHITTSLDAGDLSMGFALTISTLPAKVICLNPNHYFTEQQTWLARSYYHNKNDTREPQELIYNGSEESAWYRCSHLRGWSTYEYSMVPPREEVHPSTNIVRGIKVLDTDCDCLPWVARVGRWAQHRRGVLIHHAFNEATSALASHGLAKEG